MKYKVLNISTKETWQGELKTPRKHIAILR